MAIRTRLTIFIKQMLRECPSYGHARKQSCSFKTGSYQDEGDAPWQRSRILFCSYSTRDRLSCYGYQAETSPYLDELATDSTHFLQAYAPAQWTIPSHTSMFTGLYPGNHNMLHAYSVLPPTFTTLAERLTGGGYFTAAFCNNPLVGVVNTGLQRGFQRL